MRTIALVVEGQSEERFAKEVLTPQCSARGVHLTAYVPQGAQWKKYRPLVLGLARGGYDRVGTLFDLYGCDSATPGFDHSLAADTRQQRVVDAIRATIREQGGTTIYPHVIRYEFETLVLAAIDAGATGTLPPAATTSLRAQIARTLQGIESINGSYDTSPSHRITSAWPQYRKTVDGVDPVAQVPFQAILDRCPTFARWFDEITTF